MMRKIMRKQLLILALFVAVTLSTVTHAFAFWDKTPKVDKQLYDEQVKKSLELKERMDSLTKDYAELREKYKVLPQEEERLKSAVAPKETEIEALGKLIATKNRLSETSRIKSEI